MKDLYEYVVNFMLENEVGCEESISQCDRIREKHEEFMCDCYNLVKKDLPEDSEE